MRFWRCYLHPESSVWWKWECWGIVIRFLSLSSHQTSNIHQMSSPCPSSRSRTHWHQIILFGVLSRCLVLPHLQLWSVWSVGSKLCYCLHYSPHGHIFLNMYIHMCNIFFCSIHPWSLLADVVAFVNLMNNFGMV